MASSPDAGRSRHLGRVVDPLARDDGQTEPAVELLDGAASGEPESAAPEPAEDGSVADAGAAPEPTPPDTEDGEPAALLRGSALRERLLARAEAARGARDPSPESMGGLDEVGRGSATDTAHGAVRAPSAPLRRQRRVLSPDMIAVFGTLLGLATVASLVALVMNLEPHSGDKPEEAAEPARATEAPAAAPAKPKRERLRVPGPWRIADAKDDASLRQLKGKIGTAPFLRAIQDAGLPKKEAYRVLTALKGLRDLDKPNRTDEFVALVERGGSRVKAFEYIVSKEEVYQAREGADGLLGGKRLDLKVERSQIKGALLFEGGDLDQSAEKNGFDPGLAKTLGKAVDGHLSLEELERGDRLRIVAQEVTVLGEFSRYAGIEALEWVPAKGKRLRLYYFRGPTSRGYFDDKGRSPYEGGWRKPIPNAPITSKFNPRRMHPVLKKVMPHTGTDFGAPSGTPVGSSSFGTVSFIGYAGPSGNLVKIDHPGEIETGYAHLSRFAEGLKVGDKVKRLQVVGYVGSTGRSTGPHLHFTAKKKGEFIDPESLNLDGMRVLPKEERDAFTQAKAKYDALLDAIPLPEPLAAPAPAPAAEASPEPEPESAEPETLPDEPAQQPATPAPAPAAPAAPHAGGKNPVYLTDKELLEMQSSSDDGEVAE